jgi:predicted DNA binding CopG/RHH family protein
MKQDHKLQNINFRLTIHDKNMIAKYCENEGLTYSDALRDLIKKNIFVHCLERYPVNAGEQTGKQ